MGNPLSTGLAITLSVSIGLAGRGALAADEDPASIDVAPATPLVELHGFISQGFIKTTDNDYLAHSERGSFEFSEAGFNITRALGDDLRVGLQLFTRDLGPIGDYRARFDWFYLDYRFFDWLGVRAGRTKLPFGLYNETTDIDAARVPILLPQSVYPIASRDVLLAQTGLELYGYIGLGSGHDLEYRVYAGTLFLDTGDSSSARISGLEVPYVGGARLMWVTPIGLQLGGSAQALRFDGTYTPEGPEDGTVAALARRGLLPAGYVNPIAFELPFVLWLASAEYTAGDLTLASEYGRWWYDTDIRTATFTAADAAVRSDRFYLMGSYHVTPWFTPGVYYTVLYPDIRDRSGRSQYQHDVALTTRFDVNEHWLVKAEAHYMLGTATLNVPLNDGTSRNELAKHWGVLLLKTTAYF